MTGLWFDIRCAARTLSRKPGFCLLATLILALGIGSATSVASVVYASLLDTLPFANSEQLVRINERILWRGKPTNLTGIAVSSFLAWKESNPALADLALYGDQPLRMVGVGEPDVVSGMSVTSTLFELLGVGTSVGRPFSRRDDDPGSAAVVILSYPFWQSRFGGRTDAVNQVVQLDDNPYTIIGVMPASFDFPSGELRYSVPSLFIPLRPLAQRPDRPFRCLARLGTGVTAEMAESMLSARSLSAPASGAPSNAGPAPGIRVRSLRDVTLGDFRTTVFVLIGAVSFVLLIACSNIANLLLVQSINREKEFAIRTAIGAGPARLARQLVIETLLLSSAGGAFGVLLAAWGIQALKALCPAEIYRLDKVGIDPAVLGTALCLALVTGLVFGMVPMRGAVRSRVYGGLNGLRSTPGARRRSLNLLVASEVGLAVLLLVGAGLLMRSFIRLQGLPLGFDTGRVLIGNLVLPESRYGQESRWRMVCERLLEELQSIPGIESVALAGDLPLDPMGGIAAGATIAFDEKPAGLSGIPAAPGTQSADGTFSASSRVISDGYLRTLGIPLLAGRAFRSRDTASSPPVVLISDSLAHHVWPAESPVGKRVWISGKSWEIIGVVGDIRSRLLRTDFYPTVYRVHRQFPLPPRKLVLRTRVEPTTLIATIKSRIWAVDKDLPQPNLRTMEQQYSNQLAAPRFYLAVFGAFGALATLLAASGTYGVVSYSVSCRTHEIGLRMALGAQSREVLVLVLGQGLLPVFAGMTLGLLTAFGMTRFIASLLFDVRPTDPLTFAGVAVVLTAFAFVACWIPARRALRVDPMIALRSE